MKAQKRNRNRGIDKDPIPIQSPWHVCDALPQDAEITLQEPMTSNGQYTE